ncbi:MAG: flavin reductase [Verrucomicrobia bacterium RIFCSPLOWO2_12_FULL_64_8]|nr:MAG: flavin reductase [Verrucomicrobia bacterium RIFCSPLOWO2_12_FULL_64_8]
MLLEFAKLPAREVYGWMISTITPRPIAWVSTISAAGRTNLAPFSFFQGVTANPPTLLFVPVNNRDGGKKDTVRNIEEVPEFVVNLVPFALAETMNATSASLPYGESEFEKFGIAGTPSIRVRPPRVAAAPVAFECTLDRIVDVGEGPLAARVVFGRIQLVHLSDAMLGADGRVDPAKLDTIGRMGGESYCRTTERFALKRPA